MKADGRRIITPGARPLRRGLDVWVPRFLGLWVNFGIRIFDDDDEFEEDDEEFDDDDDEDEFNELLVN